MIALTGQYNTDYHSEASKWFKATAVATMVLLMIDGYEFIIVLQGHDYENRHLKLIRLHEKIKEAEALESIEAGKASFAAGMSIYDPKLDTDVQTVQGRADAAMYKEKGNKRR